jgi:hypothetical protein
MRRKWPSVWNLMENFKLKPKTENVCGWRLLHEGPDTVEELLDRHLVKKVNNNDEEEDELLNRRRLISTRREALSLYRDILRASRFFTWPDSKGVLWRDLLRDSARKEFEREAVHNAIDKQRQQIQT